VVGLEGRAAQGGEVGCGPCVGGGACRVVEVLVELECWQKSDECGHVMVPAGCSPVVVVVVVMLVVTVSAE